MLRHEPTTPSTQELLAGIKAFHQNQVEQPTREQPSRRALLASVGTIPDDMVTDAVQAVTMTKVGTASLPEFVQARLDSPKSKPGRPPMIPVTALLVAALLCAVDLREVSGVQMALTLYRRISPAARDSLGLPREAITLPPPGPARRRWRKTRSRRAQRAFERLRHVFNPSPYPTGQSMTWAELDQRKRVLTLEEEHELQQALDLLTTSIQSICWQYLPHGNRRMYDGSACIDATPLKLFARGRSVHDERTSTDPDGGYYVRTGDHDGEQQVRKAFYALDVHLMVGVDVRNPDRQYLPGLPLAMSAGRPGADPAGAARRMTSVLTALAHAPGYLAGDNLYTLADPATFQQPIRELGWDLVLPYPSGHTGRQGSVAGAPLVDGHWYCPAMPEALVAATDHVRHKTIDQATYEARVAERRTFELRPKEALKPGQPERWSCPAAGANPTAKCHLKASSEQTRSTSLINGQRIDLRPRITPDADLQEQPPKVCRQQTITIQPTDGGKYRQNLRFGSPEHSRIYFLLRETQEGLHGFAKDDAKEALGAATRRRARGLAANSIIASILLTAAGIRKVRAFMDAAVPDERGILYVPRPPRDHTTAPPGTDAARDI